MFLSWILRKYRLQKLQKLEVKEAELKIRLEEYRSTSFKRTNPYIADCENSGIFYLIEKITDISEKIDRLRTMLNQTDQKGGV